MRNMKPPSKSCRRRTLSISLRRGGSLFKQIDILLALIHYPAPRSSGWARLTWVELRFTAYEEKCQGMKTDGNISGVTSNTPHLWMASPFCVKPPSIGGVEGVDLRLEFALSISIVSAICFRDGRSRKHEKACGMYRVSNLFLLGMKL